MTDFSLTAIQAAPVFFDREKSLEKACDLISDAAAKGATIAAFGETWIPGYPFFSMMPPLPLWAAASAAYLDSAMVISGPEIDQLCETWGVAKINVAFRIAALDP